MNINSNNGLDFRWILRRSNYESIRHRLGLFCMSIAVGLLAATGDEISEVNRISVSVALMVKSAFFASLFGFFVVSLEKLLHWVQSSQHRLIECVFDFRETWKKFYVISSSIFLCWIPYVVYLKPGVIWYDTSNELLQWFHLPNLFSMGQLGDHHPILDTVIFGLFVQAGNALGSGDNGIFVYTIAQSAITSMAFAHTLQRMRALGASKRLTTISFMFVSFFPIVPMYAVTMVKESLFLPLFLCFALEVVDIARSSGSSLSNKRQLAAFVGLALLISLTRKTGMYIVFGVCITLIFVVQKKYLIRVLSALAATMVTMAILLPMVVFPAFNVQPGGKQEMLAIPFQQTARIMKEHRVTIDADHKAIYERVLGRDVAQRYSPFTPDPVKGFVWDSRKNQFLGQYMTMWIADFFKYPKSYIEAYAALEYGWVALPSASSSGVSNRLMPVFATGTNHSFFEGHEKLGLRSNDVSAGRNLEKVVLWVEQTPMGMIFFSRALWTTWMFAFAIYEIFRVRGKRKIELFGCVSPYVFSYLLLWISPISGSIEAMRYMIPQVFLAPMTLAIIAVYRARGVETTAEN